MSNRKARVGSAITHSPCAAHEGTLCLHTHDSLMYKQKQVTGLQHAPKVAIHVLTSRTDPVLGPRTASFVPSLCPAVRMGNNSAPTAPIFMKF